MDDVISSSSRKNVVGFVGVGTLGWQTMTASLKRHVSDESILIHELSLSRLVPSRCRVPRWVSRALDARLRRQNDALETWLDENPKLEHVHCFGHLVSSPELFKARDITYSVSCDNVFACVVEQYGLSPSFIDKKFYRKRAKLETNIFNQATHICPTSNRVSESIRDIHGIKKERIHVHPFPILDPAYRPRSMERPKVTFIGNDLGRKGAWRLIEWHCKGLLGDVELHIVTQMAMPDHLAKNTSIVWHQNVSNSDIRSKILSNTTVFVLPTYYDNSPIVLIEAAASGVPAVASDMGGVPEIVLNSKTGFIVDTHDDNAFIEKINCLITDRNLNIKFGQAARAHFEQCFSPVEIINSLVEKAKNPH